MQSTETTRFEGVRQNCYHGFSPNSTFVLWVIQFERESDLFINCFVEEGSESQYEFSEINDLVIIGVEDPEEIPCINTILQIDSLSKLFIVNNSIIFLCLAKLVKEEVEIVNFLRGES